MPVYRIRLTIDERPAIELLTTSREEADGFHVQVADAATDRRALVVPLRDQDGDDLTERGQLVLLPANAVTVVVEVDELPSSSGGAMGIKRG